MWTKKFENFPPFTHDLLEKHVIHNASVDDRPKAAVRHKKLGYQLFKSGYVREVLLKPDIKMGDQKYFIVRARVNAQMKQKEYNVYVHFKGESGDVAYANCECPAGKGGCCKHVVALLFQILDYKELELTEIPDELSCTEKLQQWNVPATKPNEFKGAMLFEDLLFERADFQKDKTGRKRPLVKGKREDYSAAPFFAEKVTKQDIERLRDSLAKTESACPLIEVLNGNDCQPFDYELFHQNLPSTVKLTSRKQILKHMNTQRVRDDILKELTMDPDFSLVPQDQKYINHILLNKTVFFSKEHWGYF
jgi:hypothetical protein